MIFQMDTKIDEMFYQTQVMLEQSYNPSLEMKAKMMGKEFLNLIGKPLPDLSFDWPMATLALALEEGYSKTRNHNFLDTLTSFYRFSLKKRKHFYFLDQIMNGYSLFFLWETNNEPWIEASLKNMYEYVSHYPPTSTGGLPYRTDYPKNVLVDYLGMVCPFLSRYGKTFNCREASRLAEGFLRDYLSHGMDRRTKLPYHGYRSDNFEKLSIIGWGRGVGWLLIGMVNTLAFLDRSSDEFPSLQNDLNELINTIIQFQDEKGYFKWMLSACEGHADTSATSMIGYSIKRAVDLDLIESKYIVYADRSLHAVLQSTDSGRVFDSLADCDGIGKFPQHYGHNVWGQGFGTAFASVMMEKK